MWGGEIENELDAWENNASGHGALTFMNGDFISLRFY